ncbi:HTH domain-containing protein (plasmid) [Lactiplantibacillus pentosus]|uniref:HTH domain-containing protein n=1 Tax=Lactiplantibacillus pentosus TaxID=1589 RepID=UPI00209068AB|nr:HTH domain-containing protein [Lactiplantibacillus pentosus]WMB65005.1 HTH domain-containing protein [Lactiplantibacillus pentosus]WMB65024.1 HTH domain-containing protein [Lactiplantibacillus pentosus]
MPKTIRELADELGVSKQAIWQKIKRDASIDLRQFTSTKGNTVYVDVDDNKKDAVDGQDEVKFLRNLVSEFQSEKKELHKLLDQQQRLALQDKQLLEEYKAEIKDLKALTMAPHDNSEKEVTSDKQPEPENSTPESQPKPKKWWRFGK